MIDLNDNRLVFKPLEEVTKPEDGYTVMVNKYWVYAEGKGILFWRQTAKSKHLFPQCNDQEMCAQSVCNKLYPWASLLFVPVVYIRPSS